MQIRAEGGFSHEHKRIKHFRKATHSVYSMMNQEVMAGAIELICVLSTALAVMISYLMTLRF